MSVVANDSHITLHHRLLALLDGGPQEVVNTFSTRPVTVQLGCGQLSPTMEAKLVGMAVGAQQTFEFAPEQGYGVRHPDLVQNVSRTAFDAQCEKNEYLPGDVVEVNVPNGGRLAGVLKHMNDQRVVIDFNHPLAGVPLRWSVQIIGVL